MQFEIGKIIEFDGNVGKILSGNKEKYTFLKTDLKDEYELLKDKVIIFRPEDKELEKRAFYIQNLENILRNKKVRAKVLKKVYKITDK